jgi:hypothetical protein
VTLTNPGLRSPLPRGRRAARRQGLAIAVAGVIAVAVAVAVAACGGSSSSSSSPSPVAATTAASIAASGPASQPAASGAAASSSPASSAAPSSAASVAAGTLPGDPCSVVTAADVEAAFGGTSSAGAVKDGVCEFQVTGQMTAGKPDVPFAVRVGFVTTFTPYATIKGTMGDAVTQVNGLGTDAWVALGVVHAQVAGGALEVTGLGVGTFDPAALGAEKVALTKTVLGHL